MEVVLMSSEIVKPSSPTPPDLRHLPLSFLDQLSDAHFMPLIFYYLSSPDSFHLKKSLSLTLSRFYPLAGRIQANDAVICNDEGIQYLQAKVIGNHRLIDVVNNSQPSDIQALIPPKPPTKQHIMSIQVNFFSCGGIAIATHSSHKTMDALSVITFANAWAAAAARNEVGSIVSPKFDMTALFPPRDTCCYSRCTSDLENNVVSKRFIFSGTALSLLRDKYSSNINNNNNAYCRPSLVEALSTFIWTRFVHLKNNNNNNKNKKKYGLIQAVNLRTRIKPHLPASYFGNLSRFAVVVTESDDISGSAMVGRMRDSIRKIDTEYLEKLKNGDLQLEWVEELKKNEGECLSFSALHKLPLQEVDFGFGSPTWVALGGLSLRNTVYFLPTTTAKATEAAAAEAGSVGVEAWINLKDEDMRGLEQDTEFLKFASSVYGLT
ncbi:stemmadenine O-acetyltransferase-like [Impatiens glandulifera]|uniref:stemmadenine O-acetyltransferase-like n=1 Tax=Impatiens glandulifera TaxID=253017 RepID=UPI001FB178E2|nr:stemmadenine O-acetyltransferase-like [Impatiens glandulifera]